MFGAATFLWGLLFVPLFGYFSIRYVAHERQSFKSLVQLIWLALLLKNSTTLLKQLLETRKQLKKSLDDLAQRYLAETGKKSVLSDAKPATGLAVPDKY